MLFLDTSAMAKLFVEEDGTEAMTKAAGEHASHIWLLDLAGLEFASLIWRRRREGRIDPNAASQAIQCVDRQLAQWNVLAISSTLLQTAKSLMQEHSGIEGLRTLDALHLAAFTWISDERPVIFASADERLCQIVTGRGQTVFNPLAK